MKLTTVIRKTKARSQVCEDTIEVHQQICGLSYSGTRPQFVTLNRDELAALIQTPRTGMLVVAAMGDYKDVP